MNDINDEAHDAELAKVHRLPVRRPGDGLETAGEALDGELVSDAEWKAIQKTRRADLNAEYRKTAVAVVRVTRTAVTHRRTKTALQHTKYPFKGVPVVYNRWRDTHGSGRYERQMRAHEAAGDQESLRYWQEADVAEKERRHRRVMDWVKSPLDLAKAIGVVFGSLVGLLLAVGIILAFWKKDAHLVLAPIGTVLDAVAFAWWFLTVYGMFLLVTATVGGVAYLYRQGKKDADPPQWMAPADVGEGGDGREILPTADMILGALRHLAIPALDKAFKAGFGSPKWPLQIFEGPVMEDGNGYSARIRLPQGADVEKIVQKKSTLAHNLVRTQREVWITEPSAAVLGLWIANPGALSGPVPEWPLLADLDNASTDYFGSVPVGYDLRGDVANARLFECNHAYGGTMGSGKSTLAITLVLGAMLDPLVEIDVFVCAPNADYEPMRPRLRTLMDGTGDEVADAAVDCMKELYNSIEYRGAALKDKRLNPSGSRSLTRAMALKDPKLRPRVVVIDECQRVFADTDKVDEENRKGPTRGEFATDIAVQLVNAARKYGITLVLLTPEPTGNSLPRKLLSVFTHKACGAIGDSTSNDAVLGTGSYKQGISAVGLEPKTDTGLNDCGTLMTVGFLGKAGLLRSCYVTAGDAARVTARAMELRTQKQVAATEKRDLLADVLAVCGKEEAPRAKDVAVRLRERAPGYEPYELTGESLAEILEREYGVKRGSKGGILLVRTERVRYAMAEREMADDED